MDSMDAPDYSTMDSDSSSMDEHSHSLLLDIGCMASVTAAHRHSTALVALEAVAVAAVEVEEEAVQLEDSTFEVESAVAALLLEQVLLRVLQTPAVGLCSMDSGSSSG